MGPAVDRANEFMGIHPLHMVCNRTRMVIGVVEAVDLLLRAGADETVLSGEQYDMMKTPAQLFDRIQGASDSCFPEEKERAGIILAHAPNDRAWRRRGWVPILRPRIAAKTKERRAAAATCNLGCCGPHGEFKAARAEHAGEIGPSFVAVVDALIVLSPEGVCRNVVGFL